VRNDRVTEPRIELFSYPMAVRWGDMDALGHVNNTIYFRYFEQARIAWFESIDAADGLLGAQSGPLIVTAACTFLQPITYPTNLRIGVFGTPPGRSSFQMEYEIRDADKRETIYTTGSSKVVWVDYTNNRSTPIPRNVRSLLPEQSKTQG